MQKSKGMKIAALLCGAVVAIAGIVLVVGHFIKGQDSYRSILIYELQGSADIEREGAGSIRAAEDLYLESGDRLTVADGSSVRLKLDDDKYVMAEENSVLSIEAAGNEADSKTKIQLEQGAITNEIQNPLSTDSEYEVNSPNSVMAVRGTIFRVETGLEETDPDAGGEASTRVSVFSGKVSMKAILEDGSLGDEILIGAGEEASCIGDSIYGTFFEEPAEIDYESLSPQALNLLLELVERDAPITGISAEELRAYIEEYEEAEDESEDEDVDFVDEADEVEEEDDTDSVDEAEEKDDADDKDNRQTSSTSYSGNTGGSGTNSRTGSGTANPGTNPGTSPGTNPGTNPGNESGNNPEDKPGTNPGNEPGNKPGNDPGDKPGTNLGNEPGNDPVEQEYTVTFMYNNKVFATQTVKDGKCAEKPVLEPAKTGKWDFDFSKKIEKDTTIIWK